LRKHALAAGAVLSAALLLCATAHAADFQADLDPAAHDNSTRAQVQGEGRVTGTLTGNRLTVTGRFSGLASNAAKARIGQAMVLGAPATTFFVDLAITSATAGSITGNATLTPAQLASLGNSPLFIQIDAVNTTPNGNLWGWFIPVAARSER